MKNTNIEKDPNGCGCWIAIFVVIVVILGFMMFNSKPSFESMLSDSCSKYEKIDHSGDVFYEDKTTNFKHIDNTGKIFYDEFWMHVDTIYAGPALESNVVKCVADGLGIPLNKLPIVDSEPISEYPLAYGCYSHYDSSRYICGDQGYLWPIEESFPKTLVYVNNDYNVKITVIGYRDDSSIVLKFYK